jgi:hypothetical protein
MRTTLDIDDDVLSAIKELAQRGGVSAGKVVSQLARQALTGGSTASGSADRAAPATVAGFRPFAARGVAVSNELIDQLRDADGA